MFVARIAVSRSKVYGSTECGDSYWQTGAVYCNYVQMGMQK